MKLKPQVLDGISEFPEKKRHACTLSIVGLVARLGDKFVKFGVVHHTSAEKAA